MAIEHTTLSRCIARLETVLATKLFDRRPTGYSLTADGVALMPAAEAMETNAVGILANRSDPRIALTGTIRVGTPEAFDACDFLQNRFVVNWLCDAGDGLLVLSDQVRVERCDDDVLDV